MDTLEVVAVMIEVGRGRFVIAQRPKEKAFGNLWEFPGGKLERGETREQCAYREIEGKKEEFPGVEIRFIRYIGRSEYIDDRKNLKIILYGVHAAHVSGEFIPKEHERVAIVSPDEFKNYDFAPADMYFVEMLQKRAA